MFAITGATGSVGSAVAEALLARGQQVRVIVRDAAKGAAWKARGAEVAVADFADTAALTAAFRGTEGVFVLSPPDFGPAPTARAWLEGRYALQDKVVAAIREARPPRVAFLSSVAAHHPAGTGPIVTAHRAEGLLKGIAPSVTYVRASSFLTNWASVAGLAKAQGILPTFGSTSYQYRQVAAADIAAVVATALIDGKPGNNVIEVTGRQEWSADDVAATFAKLFGRPVQALGNPVEAAAQGLRAAGLQPGLADLFAEMYSALGTGHVTFEHPEKVVRGTTTLEEALAPLAK